MQKLLTQIPIVIAEDDEDDYLLTMEALTEAGINSQVKWVKDGEELMEYLALLEKPPEGGSVPRAQRPQLIILDLNMPKKDGREVLQEIKSHDTLKKIPVVVLTTSKSASDIDHSYDLGVNSFIQKPVRFKEYVDMVKVFSHYWFNLVRLPN